MVKVNSCIELGVSEVVVEDRRLWVRWFCFYKVVIGNQGGVTGVVQVGKTVQNVT